jgi:hypothetical protein
MDHPLYPQLPVRNWRHARPVTVSHWAKLASGNDVTVFRGFLILLEGNSIGNVFKKEIS